MSALKITVGCDPEVFIKKDGGFVSAHGVIKGNKKNPYHVVNGAVQVDGMALEFNIDPANNLDEFTSNIKKVRASLSRMTKKSLGSDVELVAIPTAEFGEEYIKNQPDEAKELGCDPDYSCYTGRANPRPDGSKSFRTGAGHIHVGWCSELVDPLDPEHFEACCMLTEQLDYSLGLGSLLFDRDVKRRELYGQFGTFRPKPYGVEYRTLSNAWLNSESNISWVYETTMKATKDLLNGVVYKNKTKIRSIVGEVIAGVEFDSDIQDNRLIDCLKTLGLYIPNITLPTRYTAISYDFINPDILSTYINEIGEIKLRHKFTGRVGTSREEHLIKCGAGDEPLKCNIATFFGEEVSSIFTNKKLVKPKTYIKPPTPKFKKLQPDMNF